MLEAKSTIRQRSNRGTTYITIPASVAQDSKFPFGVGQDVKIKIDVENKRLVITMLIEDDGAYQGPPIEIGGKEK